jgi:metal-sulfur cluster biosynthetic enzyme
MESINETIIEAQIVEALRTCFDPEIPVNIY